jgi:hypothetical protein
MATKKFYTVGVARFEGGPRTLRSYIKGGHLGDVARIDDANQTPLLTPEQVERANRLYNQRRAG